MNYDNSIYKIQEDSAVMSALKAFGKPQPAGR